MVHAGNELILGARSQHFDITVFVSHVEGVTHNQRCSYHSRLTIMPPMQLTGSADLPATFLVFQVCGPFLLAMEETRLEVRPRIVQSCARACADKLAKMHEVRSTVSTQGRNEETRRLLCIVDFCIPSGEAACNGNTIYCLLRAQTIAKAR